MLIVYLRMKMHFKILFLVFLSTLISAICGDSQKDMGCILHGATAKQKEMLKRLTPVEGQSFQVHDAGFMYKVAICGGVEASSNLPSLTKTQVDNKKVQVLGRRNDTEIIGGEGWLLLTYKSGDACSNGTRKGLIHLSCPTLSGPGLTVLDDAACTTVLQLTAKQLCDQEDSGLSGGSVFCIIFFTCAVVYLVIGSFHRRVVFHAKGWDQLPHMEFWRRLGQLQADGCNFACRHNAEREESWQRCTNNFTDQDEPLLRP